MSSTKVIDSCGNASNGDLLVVGGTGTGKWSTKPEVRPEPVLPFVGKKIYDPVGNTTNDNRSALHCTFASGAANNGTTYQAYYGGAVRIPGSKPSNPDVTQPTDASAAAAGHRKPGLSTPRRMEKSRFASSRTNIPQPKF